MTQKSRTTLRDVARLAEVSVMTVSNVINGHKDRVSADVAKRVQEAVKELNYRPQTSGRSLRLSRDFSIGLIMLHPDRRFLNDPMNTEVAAGMCNYLAGQGYVLVTLGAQNVDELEAMMSRLNGLDGFVVFASGALETRQEVYRKMADLGKPMMIVNDAQFEGLADTASITFDNFGGAQMLAQEMVNSGARKIIFVRPDHVWPAIEERERGVRAALDGVAELEVMSFAETSFADMASSFEARLRTGPKVDAIMGGNDQFGIAALHAASRAGLSVPGDLLVSGFNGFSFREYSMPLLTSVASPAYELGEAAAEGMLKRLQDKVFTPIPVLDVAYLPGETLAPLSR